MTSWGMNQTSACSNCSLQLGNQMCNLTPSVAATIVPCLYLFVCEAKQLEEKGENTGRAFSVCWGRKVWRGVLSRASLSPSHPWANPSGGSGRTRPSQSPRTKPPAHERRAQLYLSAACLLILICKEAILCLSPANRASQWAADFFEVTVGKYA